MPPSAARSAPPRPRDAAAVRADRAWLETLRRRYHARRYVHPDPLEFLHDYPEVRDREIVGLVASALAYGNVTAMLPAIRTVLAALAPSPAATLRDDAPRTIARRLRRFRYRFTTGEQLAGLLLGARRAIREAGSLEAVVAAHAADADETVVPALAGFVAALRSAAPCPLPHLLPHPADGSACKRLNLFLRWMVRRDAVDPGGWRRPRRRQLLVPLDTHVHRTALARGWTRRRTADLGAVLEVTAALRTLSPRDPLRYDFAITRPGIRREERRRDPPPTER